MRHAGCMNLLPKATPLRAIEEGSMPRDYRTLLAALQRLDALPPGPVHDLAVEDLRASLRALSPADAARLCADVQRAALARHAREDKAATRPPGR